MQRNVMDDMIKVKIIKKDPVIKKTERFDEPQISPVHKKKTPPPEDHQNYPKQQKEKLRPRRRYTLWFVAFASLVFLFFSFSYMFSSAQVSITPKSVDVEINENISAEKDSDSAPVSFDLVVISGEETKKIEAKGKETVSVPAKGVAIFYNAFGPNPQLLSIDTRLEGSNGKLYKTTKQIVIPSKNAKGEPGKVEVAIYAAGSGPEYNSTPIDFKIFGFKGSPKYEKIYGRSKGNITGGTQGEFYSISKEDTKASLNSLKDTLKEKLMKKASEQIPTGFILFKDSVFLITDEESANSYSKEKMVPMTLKGTLYGFLFEEKKLTAKIAESSLEKYDGSEIYMPKIKDLSFTLADKENIAFSEVKNINFTLKGKDKIIWRFDAGKFAEDLTNKKKQEFNLILSNYPNVVSANLSLKPFWRMSFPEKAKNIKVMINYPK